MKAVSFTFIYVMHAEEGRKTDKKCGDYTLQLMYCDSWACFKW